jgi:DNA polymerase V
MFALVDGNNFYVTCEQVFRPSLKNRPVVVLSNNDGCAVSRSDEAKALGIKMGEPWFQIQSRFKQDGVIGLSANFTLYGDMSNRMMSIAAGLGIEQEVYSIDESFLSLDGIRGDLTKRSWIIHNRIKQWIGIPCGVGIGQTKTLAKLANHIAKSAARGKGSYSSELATVCNLGQMTVEKREYIMSITDLGEVWGIGRRLSTQLYDAGLKTALDLSRLDTTLARSKWSVVLERTVRELRGESCIELENSPPTKQQIACTRSFGQPVTSIHDLETAVTTFVTKAAEKLRLQNSCAGQVMVFIRTSPFRKDKQFHASIVVPLAVSTSDTSTLAKAAIQGLKAIYKEGFKFAKAGIHLLDLSDAEQQQSYFDFDNSKKSSTELMKTLDSVNQRYGSGTLKLATAELNKSLPWSVKQERKTPAYTTNWLDVPKAFAN